VRQVLNLLSAVELKTLAESGYHHDGGGLYLQVSAGGGKSWILRYSLGGKRREMGLGPFPTISLAAARKAASDARASTKTGQDPIALRDAERARQRLEEAKGITFDKAVDGFFTSNEAGWKNEKHRQQWRATLRSYASPIMGALPVASIDTSHVTRVLDPIWHVKPETASRLRGRIERVLDWARVRGYRAVGDNPARWRGHLKETYPSRKKLRQVKHLAALSIDDIPAAYERLRAADGTAALALQFIILTVARAGEALGATWSEVDLDEGIWTVAGSRMKAGRLHRVPLSREAIAVLRKLAALRTGAFIFPGATVGRSLSQSALLKAWRTITKTKTTVHGLRSTFRDWAAERTNAPREVAEMALAHAIGNKVEAAYRRGELMKKRAALMQQWATFATTHSADNVVSISKRRAK